MKLPHEGYKKSILSYFKIFIYLILLLEFAIIYIYLPHENEIKEEKEGFIVCCMTTLKQQRKLQKRR